MHEFTDKLIAKKEWQRLMKSQAPCTVGIHSQVTYPSLGIPSQFWENKLKLGFVTWFDFEVLSIQNCELFSFYMWKYIVE